MSSLPKTCAMCDARLCAKNRTGYCQRHHATRPEARAAISAGLKRTYQHRPEYREFQHRHAAKNARDPEINARRSAAAKKHRVWEKGIAARTPESYAKMGATQRAQRLSWCPPHLRDEYRRLVYVKQIGSTAARALILDQDAAEMARWRRKHVEPGYFEPPVK